MELYKIFAIINRAIKGLHCTIITANQCQDICNYLVVMRNTIQDHAYGLLFIVTMPWLRRHGHTFYTLALCLGNPLVTGEVSVQRASDTEIWRLPVFRQNLVVIIGCPSIWPISIRVTSLVLVQSCDCPSASEYDDVIKWKYFPCYWPFVRGIHRSPVNSPYTGQWRGALIFSFICAWINGWANNREADDLRRHCAHYDIAVMATLKYMEETPHNNLYNTTEELFI